MSDMNDLYNVLRCTTELARSDLARGVTHCNEPLVCDQMYQSIGNITRVIGDREDFEKTWLTWMSQDDKLIPFKQMMLK